MIRRPRGHRRALPPTYGWFVQQGERVVLFARSGASWSLDRVSIIQGGWGYDTEGVSKLPRPMLLDAQNAVVVQGDRVLIQFLDGNDKRPIVQAGARSVNTTDFLPYNHGRAGADANRLAARLRPRDAAGAVVGQVDLQAAFDRKGQVELLASEAIELAVSADVEAITTALSKTRVRIESDGLDVLGATGVTDQVILGRAFLAQLAAGLTDVQTVLTGFGIPALQLAALIAACTTSLTSGSSQPGGAPYLSEKTRTE